MSNLRISSQNITVYSQIFEQIIISCMGSQLASETRSAETKRLISQYSQVQKQQNPFLGTITHMIHKSSNQKSILKTFKFSTSNQQMEALKKNNRRKHLSQKKGAINILKTNQVFTGQQDQMCGITRYVYVLFEDYNSSLAEMQMNIIMNKKANHFFPEDQIIQLLKNVVNGLIFLCDNGLKNYSISKDSIVKSCFNQGGESSFKIFDTEIAKQMLPYYKILNHMPIQKGIYLAPQVLQQLSNKNTDPDFSIKSQIFSLGMVILQMCTLQPLDHYYNYDQFKINHNKIVQKISLINNYSPYLKSLISDMLQKSQQQRIGIVSLRQKLSARSQKSFSGIANSNVTQRTHKISYPISFTKNQPRFQQFEFVNNAIFKDMQGDKINQNANCQNSNSIMQNLQLKTTQSQARNRNRSFTDKYSNIQQFQSRKRATTQTHNFNSILDRTLTPQDQNYKDRLINRFQQNQSKNILNQKPTCLKPNSVTFHYHDSKFQQFPHNLPLLSSNNYAAPLSFIQKNDHSQPKMNIQIPDLLSQKNYQRNNQPQTPINNLSDSTALVSDSISLKPRLSNGLQDINILQQGLKNNFNVNRRRNSFQSPSKNQKYSRVLSNQSTPIRKVQALQSIDKQQYNHTIRQTQQQQNQGELAQGPPRRVQKVLNFKVMSEYKGPKTYGKHHFTNGAVYEGQFDSLGNFYGNGVLYYPNGKICYSGGWIDNSFHGYGVLNNQNVNKNQNVINYQNFNMNDSAAWHHYEGEFQMDKKSGFGTLFFCNGDKFSGCFSHDVVQGYGTFTSRQGRKVSGIWVQNIFKKL